MTDDHDVDHDVDVPLDEAEDFGALDGLLRDDGDGFGADGFGRGDEFSDGFGDPDAAEYLAPPVYWPALDADEAAEHMLTLWPWVQELRLRRFPETLKLPSCWPHHRSLVELLQALYDHERASFAPVAPPTAAAGWHLVLRDVEARIRDMNSGMACDRSDAHQPPARLPAAADDTHLNAWLDQLQHPTTPEEDR